MSTSHREDDAESRAFVAEPSTTGGLVLDLMFGLNVRTGPVRIRRHIPVAGAVRMKMAAAVEPATFLGVTVQEDTPFPDPHGVPPPLRSTSPIAGQRLRGGRCQEPESTLGSESSLRSPSPRSASASFSQSRDAPSAAELVVLL